MTERASQERSERAAQEYTGTFRSVPEAVREVRHAVRELCERWHLAADQTDAVELATSELATNAHKAASDDGDTFELTVSRQNVRVRVSLWDRSDDKPEEEHAAPDATGGRGLFIVAALAHRWGVTPCQDARGGKYVWVEL